MNALLDIARLIQRAFGMTHLGHRFLKMRARIRVHESPLMKIEAATAGRSLLGIKVMAGFRLALVSGILWGSAVAVFGAPALTESESAHVDKAVMDEVARQELVGVALGVLRGGEIVYLKGYGLSDREKAIPVTERTVFNLASNSKPLCGMAAMQLVEKGKLDLDADVREWVPEFPDKGEIITMRQLLCHQSGITHYGQVVPTRRKYEAEMPFLDPVNALDTFNRTPLLHPPGTKTHYSSYAFILASAVVQRAGGESYHDQILKRIAGPLGMTSLQPDLPHQGQQDWAVGYMKDRTGAVVRSPESAEYWKHGAGGYKSNIRDFALWAKAMLRGGMLGPEATRTMLAPQPLADGTPTHFALGWIVDEQLGARVHHGGMQNEATSRIVFFPRHNHGLVVLTNCGHGDPGGITTAVYKALRTP